MATLRSLWDRLSCFRVPADSTDSRPSKSPNALATHFHTPPELPPDIEDLPLKQWNRGVFDNELVRQDLVANKPLKDGSKQLKQGTYAGTQLAMTEIYSRIEQSFANYHDFLGVESIIPRATPFAKKKELYKFQPATKDQYPPHLDTIPTKDQVQLYDIFNKFGLVQTQALLPDIIPKDFVSTLSAETVEKFRSWIFGDPQKGFTIAEIEQQNKLYRKSGTDVMRGANAGDWLDWYADAKFAQQYFTGTNPTTITVAGHWLGEFQLAAVAQNRQDMVDLITNADSWYVQDYSYFRQALGLEPGDTISWPTGEGVNKYCAAPVALFKLFDNGVLHPQAIILDYKGSMDSSVCMFNERTSPSDNKPGESWAWRYAKTVVQMADWTEHECGVHLSHTHLVEEAIIVATQRMIPETSIIFQLLQPHWFRTISLNACAREVLVPQIIMPLVGYSPAQTYAYIRHTYSTFNFVGKQIPNDLPSRGFPLDELDLPRLRNYAYARNMKATWEALHGFVSSMLALQYTSDAKVASDTSVQNWCKEIRSDSGGQMESFPEIKTLEQLQDAVTMIIHIATSQHTAVNYLQNFYQAFVINKPPALYTSIPSTIEQLMAFKEQDLVRALPIGHQREWLIAAQLPWLLSFKPAEENNLINYTASLWNLYRRKGDSENGPAITKIAEAFYQALRALGATIKQHSDEMTAGTIPYTVNDPSSTAVSILI